jgi:hypothetical protein
MTEERYAAKIETREFFFYIVEKKPAELRIKMYNTPYLLLEKDGKWCNAPSNLFEMSQDLIDAVTAAAGLPEVIV